MKASRAYYAYRAAKYGCEAAGYMLLVMPVDKWTQPSRDGNKGQKLAHLNAMVAAHYGRIALRMKESK